MMLWDIIRDFFVQYIFGGTLSDGTSVAGYLGMLDSMTNGQWEDSVLEQSNYFYFPISSIGDTIIYYNLADWLSTTATIITLIALLVAISMLIVSLTKWIIRLVSLRG